MAKLYNLARMTTATVGTGTITLGSAVAGFLTFAQAGIADGDLVSYGIKDGSNSEVGVGTYSASGTTLARAPTKSTNSDAAISLSGSAEVFITVRAEDVTLASAAEYISNAATTKLLTSGAVWGAAAAVTLTPVGSTATPDLSLGFDFVWTLGAAGMTLANPANATKGGQKGIIYLVQDATGGRTITTYGSNWKFPGGTKPVLSAAGNAVDIISYVVGPGGMYCTFGSGFS